MRYAAAVGATALALLARLAIQHYVHADFPYLTFVLAVTVAAWFGLGPALLCTGLSFLAAQWFIVPADMARTPGGGVGAAAYLAVMLSTAFLGHAMHRARARAVSRETKQAQAKLAQQAALLQLAHDAILVTEPDGRISFWNHGAEEIYGWRSDEAVGQDVHDLLQTTYPMPLDEIRACVLDNGLWEGELRHVNRSGRTVIVASRWSLQRDEEGKPSVILEINRDTTERKQAEEALRETEELNRRVIESSRDCITALDLEGNLLSMSDGGIRLLDIDDITPYLNTSWVDFWPEADRPWVGEAMAAALAGNTGRFQAFCASVKGRPLWWDVVISPIRDAAGHTRRLLAVSRDITEHKREQEALERSAKELARSNAELQQFAYVASHDLQEPLRMVANFTQLLADLYGDRLDQKARDFIAYAVEGATRMQTLIQDLLAFSRVGSRGNSLDMARLERALDRAVANLELAISENGASVTHDELPVLRVDSAHITQLFQNLIGNAIKFKGAAPPRVHVSALRDGDEWTFSVRDNGIGFEPKYEERIFAVFQRLHTRDEYPGTGIGLAICRKIVERHQGRIWAESTPGSGSTFYFTLPAVRIPAERAKQSADEIAA